MEDKDYGFIKIKLTELIRLCTALDCRIEDILEFVPSNKGVS